MQDDRALERYEAIKPDVDQALRVDRRVLYPSVLRLVRSIAQPEDQAFAEKRLQEVFGFNQNNPAPSVSDNPFGWLAQVLQEIDAMNRKDAV